ncbi:MAG: division/cell wall cluster transcriptional repressor MraZ [Acidimicrobiales bacterium]
MARFVGQFEHSLDDKGRVILPAKFRPPFDHGGYLTGSEDRCLALWTHEMFEAKMDELLEHSTSSKEDRNLMRYWAANSHELEIDRQGRMAIPARLREYGELVSEVLVVGAVNRVELWNPRLWDEKVLPQGERLALGES